MAVTARVLFWCDRCNRCKEVAVGSSESIDQTGYVRLTSFAPTENASDLGGWQRWQTLKPFSGKMLLFCPSCWEDIVAYAKQPPTQAVET